MLNTLSKNKQDPKKLLKKVLVSPYQKNYSSNNILLLLAIRTTQVWHSNTVNAVMAKLVRTVNADVEKLVALIKVKNLVAIWFFAVVAVVSSNLKKIIFCKFKLNVCIF